MDRRAEPDCLRERGSSPGPSRDFAPTQVRRRTAPTKRRWRSNSVPLGGAQRPGGSLTSNCFAWIFIRVQLITQIKTKQRRWVPPNENKLSYRHRERVQLLLKTV